MSYREAVERIRNVCDAAHTDYYECAMDALEDIEYILSQEME